MCYLVGEISEEASLQFLLKSKNKERDNFKETVIIPSLKLKSDVQNETTSSTSFT